MPYTSFNVEMTATGSPQVFFQAATSVTLLITMDTTAGGSHEFGVTAFRGPQGQQVTPQVPRSIELYPDPDAGPARGTLRERGAFTVTAPAGRALNFHVDLLKTVA